MKEKRKKFLCMLFMIVLCGCASPVVTPTQEPTATETPTATPTEKPTATPTEEPTATPTGEPTATPTETPMATPTEEPMATPTEEPTATPTEEPMATPTEEPMATPTETPTPTATPTEEPVHIHEFVSEVTTKAGCVSEGVLTKTCTVCGITETEVLPALGHEWKKGAVIAESTCIQEGSQRYFCVVCETEKTEPLPLSEAHIWDEGTVTEESTCYRTGVKTYTCTLCKKKKSEDLPLSENHRWNAGEVIQEPTKTTDGICLYTCWFCKKTKEESIKAHDFDATEYGNPYHVRSTNNPDSYLDFAIDGNVLTVSGKILQDGLKEIWVMCGEDGTPASASSGEAFLFTFVLDGISENSECQVMVYTKTGMDTMYWSYSWKDVKVTKQDGTYQFVQSPVLEHNLEVMAHWVNPEKGMSEQIEEELITLSDEIVGKETDEYRKLYLLNYWVAENIYYDYDYYYGRSSEAYYLPVDVLEKKRTVCEGYANLLQKLIQAQGIPCIKVRTFSKFDESNYMENSSNHAHVEAFVDGRWITMDATWDSRNTYENGQYMTKEPVICYFDSNLDFFSYSHKLISR